MSLDSFKSENFQTLNEESKSCDTESSVDIDDFDWHLSIDGYWDSVDDRFFGSDSPNEPPLMNVPEKLAADVSYIDDSEYATEVATQLSMNSPQRYEAVMRITFNDFSVWNWPLIEGNREYNSQIEHFIDKFMPQILKWEAIVRGDDPTKAVDKWIADDDDSDYSWVEDIDNTDISESLREYFNDEVDWMPHISRVIETSTTSDNDNSSFDDSWTDDW